MEPNLEQPLPLIPLNGTVMFPGGALPLQLAAMSTAAFRAVGIGGYVVLSRRRGASEAFTAADTHGIGVLGLVAAFKSAERGRARVGAREDRSGRVPWRFLRCMATQIDAPPENPLSAEQMTRLQKLARCLYAADAALPHAASELIDVVREPRYLVDILAANALETTDDKQIILETISVQQRYHRVCRHLERRLAKLDGDGPTVMTRVWRWWSTVTRHPKFNGWAALAITSAFAALAIMWIRVHYPPGPPR